MTKKNRTKRGKKRKRKGVEVEAETEILAQKETEKSVYYGLHKSQHWS